MEELSNLEKRVLRALGEIAAESAATGHDAHGRVGDAATPEQILERSGLRELVQVMNASSWLQAKGLVRHEETMRVHYALGKEGEAAVRDGLPERKVLRVLSAAGGTMKLADMQGHPGLAPGDVNVATGWLKRKQLADMAKGERGTTLTLTAKGRDLVDGAQTPDEKVLDALRGGERLEAELDKEGLALLAQRQNVIKKRDEITRLIHLTTKGKLAVQKGIEIREEVNELTSDLVGSGKWREADIRPYDVAAFAPVATAGRAHPLRQIIDKIRQVFLEMGFSEIEGPYVRSAFWNMDALFTPQDHPAREMQDTFYLSTPETATLDDDIVARIQAIHERGGDVGSRGWRNPWSRAVAEQMLLRTHTTVDTVQYLSLHPDPPVKVFSVDRVFRNEALDATHLPEFHQVEGIVMEEGANLRQLIGLLRDFYAKMGFDQLRVRPAYFPYTEPSLEIEVYYNGRWMELGGAGIFRQEVTDPLGVKHPVLAWGLGLERLAMMMLGLKDVRDLYVSDVEWLRTAPFVQ